MRYLLVFTAFLMFGPDSFSQDNPNNDKKTQELTHGIDFSIGTDSRRRILINLEYDNSRSKNRINPYLSFAIGNTNTCIRSDTTEWLPVCVETRSHNYVDVTMGISIYESNHKYSENGINVNSGLRYRIGGAPKVFSAAIVNGISYKFFIKDKFYLIGGFLFDLGIRIDNSNSENTQFYIPDFDAHPNLRIGYQF